MNQLETDLISFRPNNRWLTVLSFTQTSKLILPVPLPVVKSLLNNPPKPFCQSVWRGNLPCPLLIVVVRFGCLERQWSTSWSKYWLIGLVHIRPHWFSYRCLPKSTVKTDLIKRTPTVLAVKIYCDISSKYVWNVLRDAGLLANMSHVPLMWRYFEIHLDDMTDVLRPYEV